MLFIYQIEYLYTDENNKAVFRLTMQDLNVFRIYSSILVKYGIQSSPITVHHNNKEAYYLIKICNSKFILKSKKKYTIMCGFVKAINMKTKITYINLHLVDCNEFAKAPTKFITENEF